eukprot:COSAG05_NODE_17026_length_333_cov_0.884615_1_plen_61_part_10
MSLEVKKARKAAKKQKKERKRASEQPPSSAKRQRVSEPAPAVAAQPDPVSAHKATKKLTKK